MTNEPRSLLRKPGEPLVCYCPPGSCQAPKGFSGPCNRATPPAVMPAAPSDAVRKALERLVHDVRDLTDNSHGVIGLHKNGDAAPWSELTEGGRFDDWLGLAQEQADAALSQTLQPQAEPAAGEQAGAVAPSEKQIIDAIQEVLRGYSMFEPVRLVIQRGTWNPEEGLTPEGREIATRLIALAAPGAAIAAREQGSEWPSDELVDACPWAVGVEARNSFRMGWKAKHESLTQPTTVQQAETGAGSEVDLIEKAAVRVGMKSLMNHGAASCVYSEGCNGVSQAHLIAFAREVALHCVAALAQPAALQYAGPWCCEKGQAAGKPVCDECASESAGYSAAMLPDITDDTPLETGEGDAR